MVLSQPPRSSTIDTIVVLGIGNVLLSDEGVGVHALQQLRQECGEEQGLLLLDGGTLSHSLLPLIEASALIVIDAVRLGLQPGAVRRFTGQRMDRLVRSGIRTAHEVGLKELLDMARLTNGLPRLRMLVGVEPQTLDWGTALSRPVEAALPHIVTLIRAAMSRWRPHLAQVMP